MATHPLQPLSSIATKDVNKYETLEIEAMTQGQKRFCHYYWYATNCLRAAERIILPKCVVAAVRSAYPSPIDDGYSCDLDDLGGNLVDIA
jgi:hypothetical protein